MTGEHRPASDYGWARQVAVPLLLTVAGLLSVDLPRLKP